MACRRERVINLYDYADIPERPDERIREEAVSAMPCVIFTDAHPSGAFLVEDADAWTHASTGIYATGRWQDDDPTVARDVTIPDHRILYVEYDVPALERAAGASGRAEGDGG